VTGAILIMTLYTAHFIHADLPTALRYASFNVVSVITGTGYATTDYGGWGAFPLAAFFFIMFIGGCAGSTTCGIKVFRFQVLYAVARAQLLRLLQPHGVFIAYYNRRPMPDDVPLAVMSFFALFGLTFAVLAIMLGLMGLDFLTAISGAATAISNVGPGLGNIIGPAGTFAPLPEEAKWVLSLGMLLGRLELFTVLVLCMPQFWRR
jgi:trk system potassium uptake protein